MGNKPMRFIFYSPIALEPWDWRNSVEKGIGGSETSHVEMAWRLARLGHEIVTYASIPEDCPGEWRDTKWFKLEEVDTKLEGVWLLYRCPKMIMEFPKVEERKNQQLWLICQDWDYPFTAEELHNVDKVVVLCKSHAKYLISLHPSIKKKIWITSNGIKDDLIEETEQLGIVRNPLRIMHASSPDRGLKQALISFKKAREYMPELEFHAFYGFDNMEKLAKNYKDFRVIIDDIKKWLDQPGVTFHGRVSQNELYKEWFKSGIYIYETDFFETSNIASQEAQAMGAVPIFSPIYAQGENIKWGIPIEGDSRDPLTNAKFAAELVRLANKHDLQESIRQPMMEWARKRFDWEVFVQQWVLEAEGKRKDFEKKYDFPEQL